MSLDLRIPLGLLFLLVGAMLSIYGFVTRGSEIYARSADLDINLIWGIVMLIFGLTMFLLGRYSDRHKTAPAPPEDSQRRASGH